MLWVSTGAAIAAKMIFPRDRCEYHAVSVGRTTNLILSERSVFMKNLLIIGAGQYGMVAKEIAESMGCFDRIDFVDDVSEAAVGKICDIEKLVHEYDSAVVALGNPELRLKLINGLCEMGYNVPTLIHERA